MKLSDVADMFKLLGENTRFRIVNLLIFKGEVCVQALQDTMSEPQAKISRHLSALRAVGFVSQRRDGRMRLYSLPSEQNEHQKMLVTCIRDHYSILPELQADLIRFDQLEQQGSLCCRPK